VKFVYEVSIRFSLDDSQHIYKSRIVIIISLECKIGKNIQGPTISIQSSLGDLGGTTGHYCLLVRIDSVDC
jgi:hypothetical protein